MTRWAQDDRPDDRLSYYFGAGAVLGTSWVSSTIVGALLGTAVPESVPLDFAVPLVFLVLLVPVLVNRPAIVAAAVGGLAAVVAATAGAGPLSTHRGRRRGYRRRRRHRRPSDPSGPRR